MARPVGLTGRGRAETGNYAFECYDTCPAEMARRRAAEPRSRGAATDSFGGCVFRAFLAGLLSIHRQRIDPTGQPDRCVAAWMGHGALGCEAEEAPMGWPTPRPSSARPSRASLPPRRRFSVDRVSRRFGNHGNAPPC